MIPILLCSCSTSRHVQMQVAERISKNTIYLSNIQYDSIDILQDKYTDRSKDTLLIKETNIEYRYKLLKDTVRIILRDSIPYEVCITETIEVPRKLTWYDHFSRAVLWLNIGFAIYWLIRLIRKFH